MLGLRFPAEAEVRAAAEAIGQASRESGLRSQIEVSPGSIRLRRTVPVAEDDRANDGAKTTDGSSPIRSWTPKSRRQMTRSYASLDLAPLYESGRLPVAITLTYPGDWVRLAPDGEAVQRHLDMFERRWLRAWDESLMSMWKREFQRRGAPHLHSFAGQPAGAAGDARKAHYQAELLAWEAAGRVGRRPRFRSAVGDGLRITQWVAHVWADVVVQDLDDPAEREEVRAAMIRSATQVSFKEALRYSDPKRASMYFAKHGLYRDKEYQNRPPPEWDGKPVGRFWGYTGLKPLVVAVQVDGGQDYYLAKRTMRRWSARTPVYDPDTGKRRYVKATRKRRVQRGGRVRTVTRPVRRLGGASGTLCVNDGPAMAHYLAKVIALSASTAGQRASNRVTDQSFWCETCGGSHPLREHGRCRDRARMKVRLR